jgi:hypothetical protein
MQDFFGIISNFGFPVAVASYLLFRFEKKLEGLEKINTDLVDEIQALRDKITELEKVIVSLKKK